MQWNGLLRFGIESFHSLSLEFSLSLLWSPSFLICFSSFSSTRSCAHLISSVGVILSPPHWYTPSTLASVHLHFVGMIGLFTHPCLGRSKYNTPSDTSLRSVISTATLSSVITEMVPLISFLISTTYGTYKRLIKCEQFLFWWGCNVENFIWKYLEMSESQSFVIHGTIPSTHFPPLFPTINYHFLPPLMVLWIVKIRIFPLWRYQEDQFFTMYIFQQKKED